MDYIFEGFREAIELIFSFDPELYGVIILSLFVSLTATILASFIAIPTGLLMAIHDFKTKHIIAKILYTLMGTPPVVLGLFVYLIVSRNGPLGMLELIYTPTAMIIAQTLLITPILISLILNSTSEVSQNVLLTCKTLGANQVQIIKQLIKEVKPLIFISIIAGFSRAISEVGAVMIVGGNIKDHTRVMTTFIALNNSQGKYSVSIAMGFILLSISFFIHSISYRYVMGGSRS